MSIARSVRRHTFDLNPLAVATISWPNEGKLISRSLIDAYMGESNGELIPKGGKLNWKKQKFENRMA